MLQHRLVVMDVSFREGEIRRGKGSEIADLEAETKASQGEDWGRSKA